MEKVKQTFILFAVVTVLYFLLKVIPHPPFLDEHTYRKSIKAFLGLLLSVGALFIYQPPKNKSV